MSAYRFEPNDRVFDVTHQEWGQYAYDAAEPGGAWVRFDGDGWEETWVQRTNLRPEAVAIGLTR